MLTVKQKQACSYYFQSEIAKTPLSTRRTFTLAKCRVIFLQATIKAYNYRKA